MPCSQRRARFGTLIALLVMVSIVQPARALATVGPYRSNEPSVFREDNTWITSIVMDLPVPAEYDEQLFCSTPYLTDDIGGVFHSWEGGTQWDRVRVQSPSSVHNGGADLAISGPALFAGSRVGTRGIYVSDARLYSDTLNWSTVPLVTWAGDDGVSDLWVDDDSVWPSAPLSLPLPSTLRIFAVTERWGDDPATLRYTLDGGRAWTVRDISVLDTETAQADVVEVLESGRVVVGCWNRSYAGDVENGGGIYISDDLGTTWTRSGCLDLNVTDIAVDPSNSQVLYACAREYGGEGSLYRSSDGGDTFVPVTMPGIASANVVEVDSLGRVMVGSSAGDRDYGGVHFSVDGGVTWIQVGTFADNQGALSSTLNSEGCNLYVGTKTGSRRYWIPSNEEIAGSNRFETAIAVSKVAFPEEDSADAVVLVSGRDFPDAVVAGPLAKKLGGVLLLSDTTGLWGDSTLTEIERVLPEGGKIVIVGGVAAVPNSVFTTLSGLGYDVSRIAGRDRYATAAAVAEQFSAPSECFVVNGTAFPDALSASAPAAERGMPILLTAKSALPTATSAYLSANDASLDTCYLAGDVAVIDASVSTKVSAWGEQVVRLGGGSRVETSLAIAKRFHPVPESAGIAYAFNFPDGLTGSVLCAYEGAPLLLANGRFVMELPEMQEVYDYLGSDPIDPVMVFGDEGVISQRNRRQIEGLW